MTPLLSRLNALVRPLLACVGLAVAGLAWAQPSQLQPATPGEPQLLLPRVTLQAGMHRIDAQVAATPVQTQTGLMWRREMPTNEGMLFVFKQPSMQCFWMRNTLIPLSIAFIADDGRIVNTLEMKPLDETSRNCSKEPVRFVLEMNKAWFSKRGIKPGSKLVGPPFVAQ
jgi:uncharacterized protein